MSEPLIDDAPTPTPKDPESAFGSKEPPAHEPRPTTRETDPPGARRLGLSKEEIEQFRESGYVIKRGLIQPNLFEPILDLWWRQQPALAADLKREDPESWISPGRNWPEENRWGVANNWMGKGRWPSSNDPRLGADVGERVGRLPHKLTRDVGNDVWRWHGIGHDPTFVKMTSAHPNVMYMIELLLGGPVKRPHRNRGIYAIFPRDDSYPETGLGTHMDDNTTEIMAVTYLEDVAPRSGGFTIFPTSAQALYRTSQQALNWAATPASKVALNQVKQEVTPIEFTGNAGDVMFCHGWTVHSAGIHESDRIRMAVVQDFNKVRKRGYMRWSAAGKHGGPRVHCDMDGVFQIPTGTDDDPADGMREVTNLWIIDVNEYTESRRPPADDMFDDWNLGQQPVTGSAVAEPAWWEKYDLPHLPTGSVPRGGGGTPAIPLSSIADYHGDGRWQVRSLRANDWMDA